MSVVLLTGCSSGIGLSAALAFARQRDRVYATMRDPRRGERLSKTAAEEDLDLSIARIDVTDEGSVQEAVQHVLEVEGRIDVLVNNAGVDHFGTVECMPEHLVRSIFETNLFGAVRMIRAALPTMRAQHSGTIVNVSSVAGRLPTLPVHGFYAASKHGLSVLSDALALEVEPFGIRVVCVEPGFIATEFFVNAQRPDENSPYRALEEAVVSTCERDIALGPEPQIVADVIVETANGTSDGSVHVLVGDDAEEYSEASRTMSELEYTALVREYVGMKPVA
jgi:NAD(P)-dependent dehydrogenase (short-subunit alcohol dehydrogenase family)